MKHILFKILREYLFAVFIGFALVLFIKEGFIIDVWAFSEPRNQLLDFIFLGNRFLWTLLLLSLIVYFILAVFEKQTHTVISAIHILVIMVYLFSPIFLFDRLVYVFLNACLLSANLGYVIHLYSNSKLPKDDILDA
jgi:hypothetical protein